MPGITSYGAYVPWYRISRKILANTFSFLQTVPSKGERSVASWDEDCITMAADAATNCLMGFDHSKIDALYFATTSQPYIIRQNAAIVAGSLDLNERGTRTADFTSCTKAGTTALLAAIDAVKSGSVKNAVVCAGDQRMVKPNSPQEQLYGDGGAALLIGNDDVIATLEGSYSVQGDFTGRYKLATEKFEHYWEDRFIRDAGYGVLVPQAIEGLMKKCKITMKDVAKLVFTYPYPREHAALAKKFGATPEQVQDVLADNMGDTGAAYPLMMFVAALEEAKPGDKIILASFGSGSDAMLFQVTDKIKKMQETRWGIKKSLARRREITSWSAFACAHNMIPVDLGGRADEKFRTSMSLWWRERDLFLKCYGVKCKVCGTPQYPIKDICAKPSCRAMNQMEPYRFGDKKGELKNYVIDYMMPTTLPPIMIGAIDFDGGGRGYFEFADWDPETITIGVKCELRLRRRYIDEARGIHGYAWKCIPERV